MTTAADARVDCAVIGAGVVGLAVARALAIAGRDVTIVEAARAIGTGISARNSEVIHAGLHYPPGSLKAELCVRGRELLYAYCASRHVPHRRIGKLLIATDEAQRPLLERVRTNARDCGVTDVEPIDRDAVAALEPQVACVAALWSPSTGIVDSHALMTALLADAEAHGAVLALSSRVRGAAIVPDGIVLDVVEGSDRAGDRSDGSDGSGGDRDGFALQASLVVNCAGLGAAAFADAVTGPPSARPPTVRFAKGDYFALGGPAPFRHLIYPLPEPGGLGIHVTLDLGGGVRFGPDVQWLDDGAPLDYDVDPSGAARFADAIRRYWPSVDAGALVPAYSGIRPKLSAVGEPAADFAIRGPDVHGVAGLVHLFGIESPGLTSALAIGERVASLVASQAPRLRHPPIVSAVPRSTASMATTTLST